MFELTEYEEKIMNLLWQQESVTLNDIHNYMKTKRPDWEKKMARAYMLRLIDKEYVMKYKILSLKRRYMAIPGKQDYETAKKSNKLNRYEFRI